MGRREIGTGGVDPQEAPSADWGWHGSFPRGLRIAGLVSVGILVALMWPRDQELGQSHLIWLGLVALVVLVGVARPGGWRRGR
ncbi:DUF2631 domain-containing protein [Pseudonocardia broussonetiae]|uniref:DUF2631 domain-containing protein n=1 Tax=Pseudonocardia broussonetiae TaxID=2736640 RepID=A0A6M6JRG9_9PSEU|nr:DUF2631 domain-containing protein [Pseudonocardia broussonetiae]QJY49905.1 DUF2631 domain-containing protein [Pseudonocardia broussonetiae]